MAGAKTGHRNRRFTGHRGGHCPGISGPRYNVVATARSMAKAGLAASPNLALVDGDIGDPETAQKVRRQRSTGSARSTIW